MQREKKTKRKNKETEETQNEEEKKRETVTRQTLCLKPMIIGSFKRRTLTETRSELCCLAQHL